MRRRLREREGAVMEKAAETEGRKRKIELVELELDDASSVQLKTPRLAPAEGLASLTTNSENSTCVSVDSDHVEDASCCSSDGSSVLAKRSSKFVDLEDETETIPEFSTTSAAGDSSDCRIRRKTSPSGEVQPESGELESTAGPFESKSYQQKLETPSQAELEEFFSTAENNLHQQFIDKYNYDIVKDQPLEGRYEWVPL